MARRVVFGLASLCALAACSSPRKGSPDKGAADDSANPAASSESAAASSASAEEKPREVAPAPIQAAAPSAAPSAVASSDPRALARTKAVEFGMIGLLNTGGGGDPNAPTAPWGRDDSLGKDPLAARGNMWGDAIGDSFGAGGLGKSGTGEGGGGRGEGIGLGSIGTIGHGAGTGTGEGFGSGSGRLGGSHHGKPPSIRMGATSVNGRLPPEVIQRIVRQNFGRFRLCYENGLKSDPKLEGDVIVGFTIASDGSVSDVHGSGSMPDAEVTKCVTRSFEGLSFPQPEAGVVKVSYPLHFAPGDNGALKLGGKALADVRADDVKAALEKAGCTEVTRKENPNGATSPTVFTAKKDGRLVTITFVASNDPPLAAADLAKLRDTAVVRQESGFVLAIACDGDPDKTAARTLVDTLIVSS